MNSKTNIDLILVKASGTALLTLALIRLPEVFRAVFQLFSSSTFSQVDYPKNEIGAAISKMNQIQLNSALGEITAFIVLLLLARWMFGFPQIMKSAFHRAETSHNNASDDGVENKTAKDTDFFFVK